MSDCCKGDFSDGMITHTEECRRALSPEDEAYLRAHPIGMYVNGVHTQLASEQRIWATLDAERAKVKALEAEQEGYREKAVRLGTALTMPCGQPNAEDSACPCCQRRWLRADPQGVYR